MGPERAILICLDNYTLRFFKENSSQLSGSGRPGGKNQTMKRILSLLTVALLGAATPAFADFNFEILWQQYNNSNYEGIDGRYFTIKVTGDTGETGKIYLTEKFNTKYSGLQTEVLTSPLMGVTEYGYSYVTGNDHSVQMTPIASGETASLDSYTYNDEDGQHTRTRIGYYLGEFQAGDEIEVHMSATLYDDNNEIVSSMTDSSNHYNSEYTSKVGIRTDPVDSNLQIASIYLPHQVNFGILGDAGNGNFVYGTSREVTVGSPLPGGLTIAIVSGLFALGFWYIRRRKTIAV